jgi:hypothetical protein
VSEDHFLSRWSRLKKASARAPGGADPIAPKRDDAAVAAAARAGSAPAVAPSPPAQGAREADLPPIESLTPESDFSPFMSAGVDRSLKRRALKTLFQDPRYNVMDGLDTYIADFSQPDPLPEGWLEKMSQMAHLGDHRPAEDEPVAAAADAAAPEGEAAPQLAEAEESLPQGPVAGVDATAGSDTPEAHAMAPKVQESPPAT